MPVVPPIVEIIEMKDYPLQDLTKDFEIANFERRLNMKHVNDIVKAILHNEFYDTVFRATRLPNNRFELIDAQHRFEAFKIVHEKYHVQLYDFILLVYENKDSRKVYRRNNIGKALQASDHIKALDDGKKLFFQVLRDYVSYYKNYHTMGFSDIIYAHRYAVQGTGKGKMQTIEEVLNGMTTNDIETAKKFCQGVNSSAGKIANNPIFRSTVYRNIYKIAHEKKLSVRQIAELVKFLKQNAKVKELSEGRKQYNFDAIYEIMASSMKKWA